LIDYYEIFFIGLPFIFKKQIDEYNAISSKTTSDGTTWTERTSGTSEYLRGVTFGNGLFVTVG